MKTLPEDIEKRLVKQASASGLLTEEELHKLKKSFAKKYGGGLSTNFALQAAYKKLTNEGWKGNANLQKLLRKRKIRTLSGVTIITVLMKPWPCPGHCIYCPAEPGMPKSYLSNEPGAMRAVLEGFDPAAQVRTRLRSLRLQGHETEKIEMIVLGGTFLAYPKKYREEFIKSLFDSCNNPSGGRASRTLKEAQKRNETARHKIIGLSVETRSDSVTEGAIKDLRALGVTKIQLGVQHTDPKILTAVKRGETLAQIKKAIKLLRDSGLKIAIHLMPNLPGSTPQKDLKMIRECFSDSALRPDQIKIYPCVVVPYSPLEKLWAKGRYKSYSEKTLFTLLQKMQAEVPEYVRIERLYRDIPGESILEGSRKTNLRQILEDPAYKNKQVKCRCIRCREIKGEAIDPKDLTLETIKYTASGGKEFFLSFVDKKHDKICALLRLRFPSQTLKSRPHFLPELKNAAIVRELHTYGAEVLVGEAKKGASQHLGLGHRLLEKAQQLARAASFPRLAIISGIGAKPYYKKWGYEEKGTYMVKDL